MSAHLPHEVAGPLHRAGMAVTRDQAKAALNDAILAGLPLLDAADALDRWDEANAPQVIGSPKCLCSHLESGHYRDKRGRVVCSSAACGCAEYREASK